MLQKQHAFDAQNAGNCFSELLIIFFFCGVNGTKIPLDERGLAAHLVVTAAYYSVAACN